MKKIIGTLFIIILLICTFVFVNKLFLNKPSFDSSEKINVYLDGIKDEEYNHLFWNNQIYISANYLMDNGLLDYYWDEGYHKISIFNNYNYEIINYNKKKAFYDKESYNREDVLLIDDKTLYFNTMFIKGNYIESIHIDSNNLNVIIEENISEYEVLRKSKLKSDNSRISNTSKILDIGEIVYVYDQEYEGWLLARTQDNIIGYIKSSDIKPISKINYNIYPALNKGKEINMAWDLISSPIKNFEPFDIPSAIDIIGPTWFNLVDDFEFFEDLSNDDYIKYVKESKKEIWAVFSNSFDPDLTSNLMNNGIKRSQIIDKIIEITQKKGFDAINIDFENIYLKDKDMFSAFIKELYCKARAENILVSVDITILSKTENWSLCYDRKVISKYADYIMLMAYDENVSGTPGSVSSLPWVEYGVKNILEYAPNEKIVLSIPFYTRLWETCEGESGLKVKSTALKIQTAQNVIEELEMKLIFDKITGQNYAEKIVDGITYMIWNEDKTSLTKRVEIVRKYDLAGYAVWTLDYGTDEMWNLIK